MIPRRPRRPSTVAALLALAVSLASGPAAAQLDADGLMRALLKSGVTPEWPSSLINAPGDTVSLLVRRADGIRTARVAFDQVPSLFAAHPDWRFDWAPGRHLLLDRARVWTGAAAYRQTTGATGRGVIVGIIDSGLDVTHPDLQDPNGKSRVLRWLDFSSAPLGKQKALEDAYGCTDNKDCAVLTGDDIDALIASGDVTHQPQDAVGHGTHVTSLAAGGGRADPRYTGIAPEASLIAARVTDASGSVQDVDILRAARFVFGEADKLGMPAVVNLSLGSDFGGHDGISALEQGLSALVGPDKPGRAIVVAAGNSAGLYRQLTTDYQAPFGIHSEVQVPRESSVRVPILSPPVGLSVTRATIYAWVAFRPGDDVAVGVESSILCSGQHAKQTGSSPHSLTPSPAPMTPHSSASPTDCAWVSPIAPDYATSVERGSIRVTVFNGRTSPELDLAQRNAAVVVIDGSWPAGSVFALRFEGHGTADVWLQSEGALAPEFSGIGAVMPRASKEATINVPATAPDLIAVGASTNRVDWTDVDDESVKFTDNGALDISPVDSIAYFSSAGPNAVGSIKPDIVAPGYYVIGAMSSLADPRKSTSPGLFTGAGRCSPFGDNCFVVSNRYGVAAGTSMATPIVAGAIALLFERDPSLTQPAVRRLLQAGARRLHGVVFDPTQTGPGALDLLGTERALSKSSGGIPDAGKSWITLSSSMIHPDAAWHLDGLCTLRDRDGHPADGFDASRLSLTVERATLSAALSREQAGLYAFQLSGLPQTGQQTARVTLSFDGRTLIDRSIPIGVDRAVAAEGVRARGGCAVPADTRSPDWTPLAFVVWLAHRRRARRQSRAK